MNLIKKLARKVLQPVIEQARVSALIIRSKGEVTIAESRFLGSLAANLLVPGPIIEIGTHFGLSTQVLCLFKEPSRTLISVDNYSWNALGLKPDRHYAVTNSILAEAIDQQNLKLVRMEKDQFFDTYHDAPPAMVFLDAIHSYDETKKDIEWALNAGARVICGHDYSPKHSGITRVVDEFGGCRSLEGTLWLLDRP